MPTNAGSSVALYIHVPFCRSRCAYCDFNTYAGLERLIPAYGEALRAEVHAVGEHWGSPKISTLYVGGGTPSLLPLDVVADTMDAVWSAFDLSECGEVTVEVNPGTIDRQYLAGLRALGVDRLSIGAQSAHEDELRMLGRIHCWPDVARAVQAARSSGFKQCSLDLLFGLPGQSVQGWRQSLEKALALDPEHLSLYGLSVEEGTPLAARIARGDLIAPEEDRAAAMYELAEDILASAGFFHYEISSWAKADPSSGSGGSTWWPIPDPPRSAPEQSEDISAHACRHNLAYWRNAPWLGLGAGACSWMPQDALWSKPKLCREGSGGQRWTNLLHPRGYATAVGAGGPPNSWCVELEEIDIEMEMGETMMLGLRLAEGVRARRFEARFGVQMADVFGDQLMDLQHLGLLTWDGAVARLTSRGRLLGNRVFERFI